MPHMVDLSTHGLPSREGSKHINDNGSQEFTILSKFAILGRKD